MTFELIDEAVPRGVILVGTPVNDPAPLLEAVALVEIADLVCFGRSGPILNAFAFSLEQAP